MNILPDFLDSFPMLFSLQKNDSSVARFGFLHETNSRCTQNLAEVLRVFPWFPPLMDILQCGCNKDIINRLNGRFKIIIFHTDNNV